MQLFRVRQIRQYDMDVVAFRRELLQWTGGCSTSDQGEYVIGRIGGLFLEGSRQAVSLV